MSQHKQRGQKTEKPSKPGRIRWIVAGVIIIAFIVTAIVALRSPPVTSAPGSGHNPNSATASSADINPAPSPTNDVGQARLVGSWLRPDGGYVLEIRSATAGGKLDAGYFNPRPINVARAEWQQKDGKLHVFVELRDVNYPGSTYTLEFSSTDDRLVGNYFQAAQRQNFDVEFVRRK